jgi:hypothetical protein
MGINEDQHGRKVITSLRGLQNLETIALWEVECGEKDLEEVVFKLSSRFKSIAGLGHVVAKLAEETCELLAEERVWLGDEDCAHASYPITRLAYLIFPNDRDRLS